MCIITPLRQKTLNNKVLESYSLRLQDLELSFQTTHWTGGLQSCGRGAYSLGAYSLGADSLAPPDLDLSVHSLDWGPTVLAPTGLGPTVWVPTVLRQQI